MKDVGRPNKEENNRREYSEQVNKKKEFSLRKILSYYPIRYHICAFALAYVLFINATFAQQLEHEAISAGVHFLDYLASMLRIGINSAVQFVDGLLSSSPTVTIYGLIPGLLTENEYIRNIDTSLPIVVVYSQILLSTFDENVNNTLVPGLLTRNDFVDNTDNFAPIIVIYAQFPFIVFFLTVAFTARTSAKIRARIVLFGVIAILLFIAIQIAVVSILSALKPGPIDYYAMSIVTSGFGIVVGGSLLIEVALFSSITKPVRTKIEPIVYGRTYAKHYVYTLAIIGSAIMAIYLLAQLSVIFKETPIAVFAVIHLLNMKTIAIFGSYVSAIVYRLDIPYYLKKGKNPTVKKEEIKNSQSPQNEPPKQRQFCPTITFLIPAANEEGFIGKCIKHVDEACYKYPVKSEIIVVNDGSIDNTERVASEAMKNLKYCNGRVFTIANSGKGGVLQYGLEKSRGEIVFRVDADSLLDKEALAPAIRHFEDPTVGSVGGMILPLEMKSVWQKMVAILYILFSNINKRTQGAADSILVQSGAYSVFRRDALVKIGGWSLNQFGEDGEITNRMGRYGYKLVFEPASLEYGDVPEHLQGLMNQRARWSIAYYHARGRNLELITDLKQFKRPRSVFFLFNVLSHGGSIIHGLMWPTLAGAMLAGLLPLSIFSHIPALLVLPYQILLIPVVISALTIVNVIYFLNKYYGKLNLLLYFPVVWAYSIINTTMVIVMAMEVALYWSSRWKKYSNSAYEDLREEMKKNVDPLHG